VPPLPVVYIDLLFLLNAAVDYALLLCTAKICGAYPKRLRLALAALLGAAFAAAAVFWRPLRSLPAEMLCGAAMSLAAFGFSRVSVRTALVFFAVAAAFGGAVYAVSLLRNGSGTLSLRALAVSLALCYAVFSVVFRRLGRARTRSLVASLTLTLGGRSLRVDALRDTGHSLSDPVTGRPVVVIERSCVSGLLPPEQAAVFKRETADAAETVVAAGRTGLRARLVPYSSVGTARGLLPAFHVDHASVDGKSYAGVLAAVSPTPLSDGGGHRAVIGGQL